MTTTWILVAHRAGARLYQNPGPGKGLSLVEAIAHPEGRLKNQDINADKPGRAFDKFGGARHSMSKEHEPTAQTARQFAKQLADLLGKGRNDHRYGQLVLVAEPHFLGELRAALDDHTAAMVTATLHKDLAGVEDHELPAHLAGIVAI